MGAERNRRSSRLRAPLRRSTFTTQFWSLRGLGYVSTNTDVRDKGENAAAVQAGCSVRRTGYGGEEPPSGRCLRYESPADQTAAPVRSRKTCCRLPAERMDTWP